MTRHSVADSIIAASQSVCISITHSLTSNQQILSCAGYGRRERGDWYGGWAIL